MAICAVRLHLLLTLSITLPLQTGPYGLPISSGQAAGGAAPAATGPISGWRAPQQVGFRVKGVPSYSLVIPITVVQLG